MALVNKYNFWLWFLRFPRNNKSSSFFSFCPFSVAMANPMRFQGNSLLLWSNLEALPASVLWHVELMFRTRQSSATLLHVSSGLQHNFTLQVSTTQKTTTRAATQKTTKTTTQKVKRRLLISLPTSLKIFGQNILHDKFPFRRLLLSKGSLTRSDQVMHHCQNSTSLNCCSHINGQIFTAADG